MKPLGAKDQRKQGDGIKFLGGFFRGKEKAIVAAVVGIISVLVMWYATGQYNEAEIIASIMTLLSALGVYAIPNKPPKPKRHSRPYGGE